MKQEIMGWQWHQLDDMQVICTLLQTENHASPLPLTCNVFVIANFLFKTDYQLKRE